MKKFLTSAAVLMLALFPASAHAVSQFLISRTSASVIYIDPGETPPLFGHYAAYAITNATGAALRTQTGSATDLARLLVVFLTTHFFLDAATLDQLSEATDGLLNRFTITHVQLDHNSSFEFFQNEIYRKNSTALMNTSDAYPPNIVPYNAPCRGNCYDIGYFNYQSANKAHT